MDNPRSLSRLLTDFLDDLKKKDDVTRAVTLAHVLEVFHERGFGVVLFIIALPMALPLPVPPGINVLLALPLILLTAQQMLGRHQIWLPESMKRKSMKAGSLILMLDKSIPWVKRLEYFVKPRLGFLTQGWISCLIGLFGLIMALMVCVPLPLTNTVPSLGIACMAIGVVMRDGLAVIAGAIIGLVWIFLLLTLGEAGIRFLVGMIL